MNMHKALRTQVALISVALSILVTGCAVPRTWQYPPVPPGTLLGVKASKSVSAKVAVRPFRDLRGENAQTESWRVAIPFYPYAADTFDRPETAKATEGVPLIQMSPSRDFARAVADELRNAGLFSSVSFVEGSGSEGSDLVLDGSIRSTGWRRSFTTYMLGPVGTIFWIVGAPMGNTTNTVAMDLQLSSATDPKRTLWRFSMQFQDEHLIGVYYGMEESVESYATAVQESMKPALADLIKIAAEHPEVLQTVR